MHRKEVRSERDKKEFEMLALLCDVLTINWDLGLRIRSAYQQKEFSSLKNINYKALTYK